jgi:serine kinase of HPr protein (carbohydrate metabolism regulator)
MPALNIHATGLLIGDRGLLIVGPSGSGKTTLALALVERFMAPGLLCRLASDDQLLVSGRGGRLICRAPPAIAGQVEVHGIGPQRVAFVPAMVADLVLRLVSSTGAQRLQPDGIEVVAGIGLPRVDLVERNVEAALPIVASRLRLAPFL